MDKFARKRTYLFAVVIGAALFLLTPALKADTLTIVLSPTTFNVSPGQSFTVNGTLSQSVADSLRPFSTTISAGGLPFTFFDFDPAYITSLTGSNALTIYSGPIIDLTVSPSATIGGTFSGFAEANTTDSTTGLTLDTGRVPYTVTIVGAAVPEPSTLLLLGTGLVGLIGVARKRLA